MIEIRTLDVGGGAIRDSPEIGGERFGIAPLETLIALPQSFCDYAGHGLASSLGDGLRKAVSFRIFDIKAHGCSTFLYTYLPFFILPVLTIPGKGVTFRCFSLCWAK